jgi:site-specific DNA-methyltransferase (cytosine-N4-specific)
MPRSDLPFGSEFSPQQVELPALLQMGSRHGGNWQAFEAAIRAQYFEGHDTTDRNKAKLANNTRLSMIAYGLIDRDARLTELGQDLDAARQDDAMLHALFARHILLNLHGMTLIQCVRDIQAAGERVTLIRLREWLDARGVHFPRGGRHPSTMHLWLRMAGVFGSGWTVDEARLAQVVGTTADAFDALASLTKEQAYYLRALANVGDGGPHAANEIEALASATYGAKFNEKSLPKDVLYPLCDAGYITLERTTGGRGAKSALVRPTDKVRAELVEPLLRQIEAQVNADLRPYLRQPLAEILTRLDSSDRHVKGLALEALALKLMRLLDMDYVATRLRGAQTGGAEVDLVFESSRLVFSRWQVQCKNTARVSLDDVAKEVGLKHLLKSNVIVIVSTGKIGDEARRYGNTVMRESNLCVVMVDGDDVLSVRDRPASIVDIFCREARRAMTLKALRLEDDK